MARTEIDGHLGQDAELRFTPSGAAVLNMNLAENHYRKTPTGEFEQTGTTWYEVAVWNKAAETLAELGLRKGTRVLVLGNLRLESFTTQEGVERTRAKVSAFKVVPYPSVPASSNAGGRSSTGGQAPGGFTGWGDAASGQAPVGPGNAPSGQAPSGQGSAGGQGFGGWPEEPPF